MFGKISTSEGSSHLESDRMLVEDDRFVGYLWR